MNRWSWHAPVLSSNRRRRRVTHSCFFQYYLNFYAYRRFFLLVWISRQSFPSQNLYYSSKHIVAFVFCWELISSSIRIVCCVNEVRRRVYIRRSCVCECYYYIMRVIKVFSSNTISQPISAKRLKCCVNELRRRVYVHMSVSLLLWLCVLSKTNYQLSSN